MRELYVTSRNEYLFAKAASLHLCREPPLVAYATMQIDTLNKIAPIHDMLVASQTKYSEQSADAADYLCRI